MTFRAIVLATGLALCAVAPPAFAACALTKMADLPVTMRGRQPQVHVGINGTDEALTVSSGGFINTVGQQLAADLKLPRLKDKNFRGLGGIETRSVLTTVNTLTLSGQVLHDVQFLITPNDRSGSIGGSLLGMSDVEYDFKNSALRFFASNGCPGEGMAYWAKDQDVSVLAINWADNRNAHTKSDARVNGVPVSVTLASAGGMSWLSLAAARRIGLNVDGPGARYLGLVHGGGPDAEKAWIVPVDSFKIGQEEIRNTELRVMDEGGPGLDADMTLGGDFFLSHRIFVANSQHKLYFTYNGGPVFTLEEPKPVAAQ